MKNPIKTLIELGKWSLIFWASGGGGHSLRPRVNRYWSGKITHYCWWRFEVVRDDRGGVVGIVSDLTGLPREQVEQCMRKPRASAEEEKR